MEQVCHKTNGLVVSNANEFSVGIDYIAENPDVARSYGKAGRRMVEEKFSVSAQVENMQDVLNKFWSCVE